MRYLLILMAVCLYTPISAQNLQFAEGKSTTTLEVLEAICKQNNKRLQLKSPRSLFVTGDTFVGGLWTTNLKAALDLLALNRPIEYQIKGDSVEVWWTRGNVTIIPVTKGYRIIAEDAMIYDIVTRLSKYYNYKFINKTTKDRLMKEVCIRCEPCDLKVAMEQLRYAAGIKYEIHGDTLLVGYPESKY